MMSRYAWLVLFLMLLGGTVVARGEEVTLSPGDVVKVDVLGEQGLSANYTVADDGAVSMPMAGRVVLAHLTPAQAGDHLAKALSDYVRNPQVSLAIVERAKLRVTVVGAVSKPGMVSVTPETRLAEAIALAGGVAPQADPTAVRIVHAGGQATNADLTALSRGDLSQNLELAQDDQVIVPILTPESGVRIMGQVRKPGLYPVGEGMGLPDLISAAGGLETTASPRDASLIRASGEKTPVDLTQLAASDSAAWGIRLQRGDTLVVPGMTLQVYLLGGARAPGPLQLRTGATLLDAIVQAGGVTPTARLKDAYLLRKDLKSGAMTRLPLHLDLLLSKGQTSADVPLQDGDRIVIPEPGVPQPSFMDKAQPFLFPLLYLLGL